VPVRVAAISFLNPAPLLYNFEHEPAASLLRERYDVHYTTPARCAAELHAGAADLGLIPIAQLTPDLAVVPGCTIASMDEVRSILLLVRCRPGQDEAEALRAIRSIAADSASRSSAAYVLTILGKFYGVCPPMVEHAADPLPMLAAEDAALLIGDPALLARERRAEIDAALVGDHGAKLLWLDLAQLWRRHTGLPWVAAVWAVRPEALPGAGVEPSQLVADLLASRDAGLAHTEELVAEWLPRLPLAQATIRTYLTRNIHYLLDEPCLQAAQLFRDLAAEQEVLPPLPKLRMLLTADRP
jgi:chorismate dehydratase